MLCTVSIQYSIKKSNKYQRIKIAKRQNLPNLGKTGGLRKAYEGISCFLSVGYCRPFFLFLFEFYF